MAFVVRNGAFVSRLCAANCLGQRMFVDRRKYYVEHVNKLDELWRRDASNGRYRNYYQQQ